MRRTQWRQRAQGFGERMRGHHDQHQVGAGHRLGQRGGGAGCPAGECRAGNAGFALALDRGGDRRVAPHKVVACPWRAIKAASAVPQEPAPRTATDGCGLRHAVVASGVAGGFRIGQAIGALALQLRLALAQGLAVQAPRS